MKIYDITQEVFGCHVFPGDPVPSYEHILQISAGDICNLTKLEMCVHNGTHLDAPWHFYDDGKKIEELDLSKCIGKAIVVEAEGELTAEMIRHIFTGKEGQDAYKRILFKGNVTITSDAARELNRYDIELLGGESQTVGPEDAPAEVHYELLGREVILLEGLVLSEVPAGEYLLSAAPIKLGGTDGAPCRAVLLKQ